MVMVLPLLILKVMMVEMTVVVIVVVMIQPAWQPIIAIEWRQKWWET